MKLIEKLAKEFCCCIKSECDLRDGFEAGFRKAREMSADEAFGRAVKFMADKDAVLSPFGMKEAILNIGESDA